MNELNGTRNGGTAADVAITGMGCIFPGAANLVQYRDNLLSGKVSVSEIPPGRWNNGDYFSEDHEAPDRIYTRRGGFIAPFVFDPLKFGIPPSAVASIEPMQLLALAVARAALDDAGYDTEAIPGDTTSVILGVSGGLGELGQKYVLRSVLSGMQEKDRRSDLAGLPEWTEDSFPGILPSITAGRIANRLNLRGVSFSLDAACASSLAAVWLGCRELMCGSSDLCLVGGADVAQSPFNYLCFAKTRALSARGTCRPFDESADGTCISEGVGIVVLKRLRDAERDHNRIYAVIKGVGGASDGRTGGITAPDVEGQLLAYKRAYAMAGIGPASVGLVETHGTGTAVGDRVEMESLVRLFESDRAADRSVAVGSVKSQIGHTKSAAGIAGLIKAALALHHKVLPPSLGVQKPLDILQKGPLYVNSETRPWFSHGPRRAAVSAFGFGGADFHAVLEEHGQGRESPSGGASGCWPTELFLWLGKKDEIVAELTALCGTLSKDRDSTLVQLAQAAWTGNAGRSPGCRLAIIASSRDDLAKKVHEAIPVIENGSTEEHAGILHSAGKPAVKGGLAFLFSGQGSQYPDMFKDLCLCLDDFRTGIERADGVLAGKYDIPLSGYLYPPPAFTPEGKAASKKNITKTNVAQAALGAVETGLFRILSQLGIVPDMVAGHSYGEYAALCAAGCLSEADLLRVSEARGRFILDASGEGAGTMVAVGADHTHVGSIVAAVNNVWVANINSPVQTIIAGTKAGIEEATAKLEAASLPCKHLAVSCAFHSPLIASAKDRLKGLLSGIDFSPPRTRVFSNSTGGEYPRKPDGISALLSEHLVSQVQFVNEIESMIASDARIFLEVGPRAVLSGLVNEIAGDRELLVLPMDVSGVHGITRLQEVLATLAMHGVIPDLGFLFAGRTGRNLSGVQMAVPGGDDGPVSSSAWLVDGATARPVASGAAGRPEPLSDATKAADRRGTTPSTPVAVNAGGPAALQVAGDVPVIDPVGIPESERDWIVAEHHRLMGLFLQTHRSVMAACLSGGSAVSGAKTIEKKPVVVGHTGGMEAPPGQVGEKAGQDAGSAGAASAGESNPVTPRLQDVEKEVLRVASERTGYPAEMLNMDAALEAELGIDSIKRVEIAGRLRKLYGIGGTEKNNPVGRKLVKAGTLKQMAGILLSAIEEGTGKTVVPAEEGLAGPKRANSQATTGQALKRYMFRTVDAPSGAKPGSLLPGSTIIVTSADSEFASALGSEIVRLGGKVAVLSPGPEAARPDDGHWIADFANPVSVQNAVDSIRSKGHVISGLIHAPELSAHRTGAETTSAKWKQETALAVKSLFFLARALSKDLRDAGRRGKAFLSAVIRRDPESAGDMDSPANGGIEGFLSTLALEWPEVVCKTIAVPSGCPAETTAHLTVNEMRTDDGDVHVIRDSSTRQIRRFVPVPLSLTAKPNLTIEPDWVILVTGGARGITARVAIEIAAMWKPHLVLVGRSPEPQPEESAETRTTDDPTELRRKIGGLMRMRGLQASLSQVETEFRALSAEREIRRTIASIRKTGAKVSYVQGNAADMEGFPALIQRIRKEHGRLDGIIHGAGLIEDKLVEDKQSDSFDRVFDTKADSGFALCREIRGTSLSFVAFFSSIAACGNAGQSDYSAANGVLNRFARSLARQKPQTRVVSVLWGPWKGGMASEGIQERFKDCGVQVIDPDHGARAFTDELQFGRPSDVEVILGDGPWGRQIPGRKGGGE